MTKTELAERMGGKIMKQTTYAGILMLAIIWMCGSINACDRIGLGQAIVQLIGGMTVMMWAVTKGQLWEEKQ